MSLSEVKENKEALISEINGDTRFMSRITSIGLTPAPHRVKGAFQRVDLKTWEKCGR